MTKDALWPHMATVFLIPFVMVHLDAEDPKFGVEITDSAYVVVSMMESRR
jgi:GTP-dependent phosphoenolpyruvate carboxykinase